jgi:hypothetical protein
MTKRCNIIKYHQKVTHERQNGQLTLNKDLKDRFW